jgi:hypothetical protein
MRRLYPRKTRRNGVDGLLEFVPWNGPYGFGSESWPPMPVVRSNKM